MRVVVVSVDPVRFDRMGKLYPTAELFKGISGCPEKTRHDDCTPKTYQNLARRAVAEGWGLETVVIQDDVLVRVTEEEGDLIIYGKTSYWKTNRRRGPRLHVCPKAFRASPEIWRLLAEAWDGQSRICEAWMPVVDRYGKVLDVTAPIDL